MKKRFVFICFFAFTYSPAMAADQISKYCLKEEIEGDTGAESVPIGFFEMTAELRQKGNRFFVSFSNHMPDSGQILEVNDIPAKKTVEHTYSFRFTDNWGNRGKGSLHLKNETADIDIDVTKPTSDPWGKNALRQYGAYTLTKADCE